MPVWSDQIKRNIKSATSFDTREHLLESFFVNRIYVPKTKEEERELAEFSLITSAMILMIHVAESDKVVKPEEKKRIIDDLVNQLKYRPDHEYQELSKEFGHENREIIEHMYDKLVHDYENGKIDLDGVVRIIDMVYKYNPPKRLFLLRLCYHCVYADSQATENEKKAVKEIAEALRIVPEDRDRIEKEVIEELGKEVE